MIPGNYILNMCVAILLFSKNKFHVLITTSISRTDLVSSWNKQAKLLLRQLQELIVLNIGQILMANKGNPN